MPDNRVTQTGGRHYATKSRRSVHIRTPGGVLRSKTLKKTTKGPRCADCAVSLPGIKHLKNSAYRNLKKREKTVSRAYGGSICGKCVKSRIVRAFLLEEQKAVRKLMTEQK
mmetsp:Transcript_9992/g.14133  ORF Transcript_9992/g.14133 Transcript_9992/m.14133 type:complete len:111 (-) Transcript_9992:417-749(-)